MMIKATAVMESFLGGVSDFKMMYLKYQLSHLICLSYDLSGRL